MMVPLKVSRSTMAAQSRGSDLVPPKLRFLINSCEAPTLRDG